MTDTDTDTDVYEQEYVIQEREEVGFFFLKDTVITLLCSPSSSSSDSSSSSSTRTAPTTPTSIAKISEEDGSTISVSSSPITANAITDTDSVFSHPNLSDQWMDVDMVGIGMPGEGADEAKAKAKAKGKAGCHPHKRRKLNETIDNSTAKVAAAAAAVAQEDVQVPPSPLLLSGGNIPTFEDVNVCPRCNLVLHEHPNGKGSGLQYSYKMEPNRMKSTFFNGCMKDAGCCAKHKLTSSIRANTSKQTKAQAQAQIQKQRSDAALLLGMILQCRHEGFLRVETFQILPSRVVVGEDGSVGAGEDTGANDAVKKIPDEREDIHMTDDDDNGDVGDTKNVQTDKYTYKKIQCSIAMTISLPHLEKTSREVCILEKKRSAKMENDASLTRKRTRKRTRNSIGAEGGGADWDGDVQYDEYISPSDNGFPPYGQLLFSMMRCDWSWLEDTMKSLVMVKADRDNMSPRARKSRPMTMTRGKTTSVFPSTLSLEDIYSRIRGATNEQNASFTEESVTATSDRDGGGNVGGIFSIPDDLLQSNLAPFLRAKSLYNLRCTCKCMNHVLRAVVPGMKLTLYPHQVRSLQWMSWREMNHMTDDDAIQYGTDQHTSDGNLGQCQEHVLCGDVYRSVSSGSILSVMPRRRRNRDSLGTNPEYARDKRKQGEPKVVPKVFWHINTYTGESHLQYRNERTRTVAKCRNVARGGLLCDDPGLGKTITILSLILQTFGQSTERSEERKKKSTVTNDTIIETYWKENLVDFTRRHELLDLCLKLRKCDREQFFQDSIDFDLSGDELEKYQECIQNPICLGDVKAKIHGDKYGESLSGFVQDVQQIYRNAMTFYPSDSKEYDYAREMWNKFDTLYEEFRLRQLKAAIGSQKRIKTSLAAIISESKRLELQDNLIPSSGTLLVVPHTLVEHWEEQIKLHVDFSACSKKPALIFRHRSNTKYKREYPYAETSDPEEARVLCQEECTYFPFVFIDESNSELPSKDFLSMFLIVLTTTKRLTAEWRHGSVEDELRKSKAGGAMSYRSFNYDFSDDYRYSTPCPLLKVNWLRLIVDEGHTMGKKGAPTNSIEFSSWITADKRWAMTGTPTPQTTQTSLGNLFGLFRFLKHDYFSIPHWGDERCKALHKGLKEGHFASFFRLQHLLNLFMVRHTKKDVEQLHKPTFVMTRTNMSQSETLAYDTLVTAVQMNLIITSMKGKTSGMQDSLLHVSQGKHAKRALSNIRLACSGGTSIVPTLTEKSWCETIELMRTVHNADKIQMTQVENFLTRMTTEQLSSCMCCGSQLQTLLLFPCACQICTGCMDPNTNSCILCGEDFDVDEFQKLQPGLDYTWKWNIEQAQQEREARARLANTLRLLQNRERGEASNNVRGIGGRRENDDMLRHDGQAVNNANIQQRQQNQHRNQRRYRKGDPHDCQYPDVYVDGRCKICSEVHLCNLIEQDECNVCHCKAEKCPDDESKSYYLTNKLIDLWALYRNRGVDIMTGRAKRPLKVIVFSQFKQVSQLVGDRLIRRFGTGCIAEYWGANRNNELERFAKLSNCFCMLLNRDGSHGLNLSFTTHIFFLDEIFDKSLESQVVARAYRMGATEKVFVEQLVSRHSIEELIVMMNNHDLSSRNMLYANPNHLESFESEYYNDEDITQNQDLPEDEKLNVQAKVRTLLSKVKLIRRNEVKPSKPEQIQKERKRKVVKFEPLPSIDETYSDSNTELNTSYEEEDDNSRAETCTDSINLSVSDSNGNPGASDEEEAENSRAETCAQSRNHPNSDSDDDLGTSNEENNDSHFETYYDSDPNCDPDLSEDDDEDDDSRYDSSGGTMQ